MKRLLKSLETAAFRPVDERTYALVRITFAVVVLIHICALWPIRLPFFSSAGLVPPDADGNGRYITLFRFIQTPAAVSGFMLFAAVAALFLALGVLPRLAAIAVMIWLVSYNNHLSFMAYGADFVMRVFGFLIMISPLGACWVLKNRFAGPAGAAPAYGLLLMRLQLIVIYVDTALAKCFSVPWRTGEAFANYMLSIYSQWQWPIFIESPWISKVATYGALGFEFALPILLLLPRTRGLGILLGVGFHLAICVISPGLIYFSLAMVTGYVAFLDESLLRRLLPAPKPTTEAV